MADISQITLPNGVTYNLKDSVARQAGTTDFVGASIGTTEGGSSEAIPGVHGLVPAPSKPYFLLSAEGSWQPLVWGTTTTANGVTATAFFDTTEITELNLSSATTTAAGVMSATDKTKLDGIEPGTSVPLMDGTGTAGSSTAYARANHVHPTDTSRAPLASPAFTGTPTAPTATAGTNTTQVATTAFVKTAVDAVANNVEISSVQPTSESIKLWIEI